MNWKKLGQIFSVEGDNPFLLSHAANPVAISLGGDVFRIFYSGRDAQNRSSVSYVDIDILKQEIRYRHPEPVITFGPEDSFYSHGISIGNVYKNDAERFILFMGWQIREGEHWRGDVGRLQLIGDDQLVLNPSTPFMMADKEDPISLSYPFVLFHEGIFKMWYGSTVEWDAGNGEMIHAIKYATSSDGVTWKKFGVAVPYTLGVAQAFSKPSVLIGEEGFHMWFSYRDGLGTPYRIGYANSVDGANWALKLEETGITVSEGGWDSNMICYPYVFEHKGQCYMLYNGNDYGRSGFGLAVLEKN